MASGPITSWQIGGETMETVTDFILGGSKITADSDHSHEIKRHLLLGRKVMANLDSILKRETLLCQRSPSSQSYSFSSNHVWMCELYSKESWPPKNWCFRTVGWRRLLRVSWTARRSNQSILKEISPEYSLEGLMLKLKLQNFGHLMRRTDSLEKTWSFLFSFPDISCWERLKVGGEADDKGWDGWMASLTQWAWIWVNSVSWWWTGKPVVVQFMGSQIVRHDWATELNWTDTWS